MTSEELKERTKHNLTLHPPEDEFIGRLMSNVRSASINYANLLIDLAPISRELSLALTEVEAACQHAIAAIARNQEELLNEQ